MTRRPWREYDRTGLSSGERSSGQSRHAGGRRKKMASDDAREQFKAKIARMARIVLARRAVPFLGAGVSMEAKLDSEDLPEDLHHTTAMLKRACCCALDVAKSVRDKKPGSLPPGNLLEKIEDAAKSRDPSLGLAEVCEIALSMMKADGQNGAVQLVRNVLRIPDFRRLLPTKAHRYIAFLAREGLIDEVFTTNFDCCMERAYTDSFSRQPKGPVNQIHDGSSYRHQVGRTPSCVGERRQYPRLTIFKLNGCAEAVADVDAEKEDTILLTERQLQNWRERQWARDVFRDRLRCRSLIFSGFGSPEPQIRHTVVQILEEMSASEGGSEKPDISSDDTHPCDPDNTPRAPYVACHKKPTFHQWQIVNAFCQGSETGSGLSVQDLLVMDPAGSELSADRFWELIYRHVVLCVLQALLGLRSDVAVRVRLLCGGGTRVLDDTRSLLDSLAGMHDEERRQNPDKDILGWLEEHETTRFARWLHVMQAPPTDVDARRARGIYLAIRDHGILVGDFLLVWAALVEEVATNRRIFHEEPEIGLRVDLDGDGLVVYLSGAEKCEVHSMQPDEAGRGQRIALLILGPRLPGVGPAIIRPRDEVPRGAVEECKAKRVKEDRVLVRLYLDEILQQRKRGLQDFQALRKFLHEVALTPTPFYRERRKSSLEDRLEPLEEAEVSDG